MSSPAILLTGATGLLGRFILRRLLQAGYEVAVLVRVQGPHATEPNTREIAKRRVEQVLQPFESESLLPRPRVIVWDLAAEQETTHSSSQLNLSNSLCAEDHVWLSSRRLAVVHCAASIRFQADSASAEPYRTNVLGTDRLLDLCLSLQVSAFHHVSTAYVGDHRRGDLVLEQLWTSDAHAGNDYERSKIQAENRVVQRLSQLPVVIHRPSIVVGDSVSYRTSTFHGFYAPLQIGWQYARSVGFSEQAGTWFRERLGLQVQDRKNLVTVDWVAEAIVQSVELQHRSAMLAQPGQPKVLHWTHPQPVTCHVMQSAIVDAIEKYSPKLQSQSFQQPDAEEFRQQMKVYESYFQSDPEFDRQNTSDHFTTLDIPPVDDDLLARLSEWAIKANFGWPKPALPQLSYQQITDAICKIRWLENQQGYSIVRVQLLGPSAPETFYLAISDTDCGKIVNDFGFSQTWRLSMKTLEGCITGRTNPIDSVAGGYWLIEGASGEEALDCAASWINHIRRSL